MLFVIAVSSLNTRPGFPHFIFSFIDPACGNCFKAWIKVHTSPLMRLSHGDDLISPTVKLSSLKYHLLSNFSSCPHSFSWFFCHFTFSLTFPLLLSCRPCFFCSPPKAISCFFFSFLFLSPSLLFTITPSVLRPHLSFFLLGRIEREGRAALSFPETLLPSSHFLLMWFEGSTHLPLPPFPPLLWVPLFLLTSPEKSKSVLYCYPPPLLQQKLVWSMKHFPDSPHKCLTRSVLDFQQHPSFVCLVSARFLPKQGCKAGGVCRFLFTVT